MKQANKSLALFTKYIKKHVKDRYLHHPNSFYIKGGGKEDG